TFSSDEAFHPSVCTGDCATAWPPLTVTGSIDQPADVLAPVGAFKRDDGTFQVTIGGRPLYRFSGDKAPGEAKGAGVTAFGGRSGSSSRSRARGWRRPGHRCPQ